MVFGMTMKIKVKFYRSGILNTSALFLQILSLLFLTTKISHAAVVGFYELNQGPSDKACSELILNRSQHSSKDIDETDKLKLAQCFVPQLLSEGIRPESPFNQIGTPSIALYSKEEFNENCVYSDPSYFLTFSKAKMEAVITRSLRVDGKTQDYKECVKINPKVPSIYFETHSMKAALPTISEEGSVQYQERELLQLVYRFHFQKTEGGGPTTMKFFETHSNAGMIAMVTLDAETFKPLAFQTVHSCGCYLTMSLINNSAWSQVSPVVKVDGVDIPTEFKFELKKDTDSFPKFMLRLAANTHQVKQISLDSKSQLPEKDLEKFELLLQPMSALDELPLFFKDQKKGDVRKVDRTMTDGQATTASFFYLEDHGKNLKGLVRGASNPRETWASGVFDSIAKITRAKEAKIRHSQLGWDRRFTFDQSYNGAQFFSISLEEKYREQSQLRNYSSVVRHYEERCVRSKACPGFPNLIGTKTKP